MMLVGSLSPLLLGYLLDKLLGDPLWLPHPVVGFGKLIGWGEHRFNRGCHRLLRGACWSVFCVLVVFLLVWGMEKAFMKMPGGCWSLCIHVGVEGVLVFFCLAGTTLMREVREVFKALDCSLQKGRMQVARIVGRDTSELSAQEIRLAALETLAENMSDGVVAPLLWYALLGLPGMMAYKMINTLDSMIGYRTERYRAFGCFAARMDDVANLIPARLTALLILLAARFYGFFQCSSGFSFSFLRNIRFVLRFGPCHASPNSGWPEAALAAVLNVRFGGTHSYFGQEVYKPYIGTHDRQLTTTDMDLSIRISFITEWLAVGLTGMIFLMTV